MSSKEEEDEDSEGSMNMMKMIERESREEELKKTDLDDYDNDEVYLGSCCEKCQHVQQSYGDKMIVPEKLSRGCLQAQLEGQGTYECAFTGLIFEAKEQVLVSYSILSWSKFNEFVQNAWMIAGPIFNVQTVNKDASALKSIQFPHSLCLAEQKKEKVFGVLHVTGTDLVIERVQYSGSHLKWSVSSLSPVGSIARDTQRDEHHGAVLIYKDLWSSIDTHTFRIYLALNCSSWHEDIKRELELKKGRFSRVDKNPNCLLVEGKYQLMSTPREEIHPENLPFTLKPTEFKGYFEASFKQPLPFTFNVKLRGTDDTTWSANIQQGDLLKKPNMLQLLLSWFQLGSRKSNTCEATVSLQEQQSLHPESEPNTETDSHHVQSDVSSATALKPIISSGFGDDETVAEGVIKVADEATVSLQEQQSLHPESEPNTEPDSHHVQIQSDVSSTTALKPSLPSRFSDNETVAEGVMQVAGASGMKEPQISQTTDNFVKKNWGDLIRRVTDAMGIADDLFQKEILTDETYEKIWNARPRQAQMRILLHTVNLKGTAAISAFCDALQQHESCLFNDLAEGPGR